MKIGVIIPALNEEGAVGQVVRRCRQATRELGPTRIVVSDNGSRDGTVVAAQAAGAEVVSVPDRGYGVACLCAIAGLGNWPDLLVFLDADGSSRPEEIVRLIEPIIGHRAHLTIGCRPRGSPMTLPQRWGNWLTTRAIEILWGCRLSDIGPFRAVRRDCYDQLGMQDRTWGWTVEMQLLALRHNLKIEEVPVSWERRIAGASKISGTVFGVLRAGCRIVWTIARYALTSPRSLAPFDSTATPHVQLVGTAPAGADGDSRLIPFSGTTQEGRQSPLRGES